MGIRPRCDQRWLAHAPAGDNPGRGRDGEEHEADADDGAADIEGDQQGAGDARDRAKPFGRYQTFG